MMVYQYFLLMKCAQAAECQRNGHSHTMEANCAVLLLEKDPGSMVLTVTNMLSPTRVLGRPVELKLCATYKTQLS